MREKRCTKCKWFRKSRGKIHRYKDRIDYSAECSCLGEALGNYYCINRWWNVPSQSWFRNGDVCEDFEFKSLNNHSHETKDGETTETSGRPEMI